MSRSLLVPRTVRYQEIRAAGIGSQQPIEEEPDFDAPGTSHMVAKGASICPKKSLACVAPIWFKMQQLRDAPKRCTCFATCVGWLGAPLR
jgi:hypothetical protein